HALAIPVLERLGLRLGFFFTQLLTKLDIAEDDFIRESLEKDITLPDFRFEKTARRVPRTAVDIDDKRALFFRGDGETLDEIPRLAGRRGESGARKGFVSIGE
ncbi:hypothetical protein N9969_03605, partial [Akkermansiaceae bacterium]|nr:hypothetical protein [Akkermansiaceae bacterium]